ncbi:hypothetical protein ES707_06451 [subsurface metagenome]
MTTNNRPRLNIEFSKNANEVIRVQLVKYNNKNLLDVRVWVLKNEKDYVSTKKGISFRIDQVDSLKQAIDKAAEELARWKRDI